MSERIFAPFTVQQVAALNEYQETQVMHPFTCGGSDVHCREVLIATEEGWICPKCGYTQNWAHDFMANGAWKKGAIPCHFDHNGECLICDASPSECEFFRLASGKTPKEDVESMLELFKDYLTDDAVEKIRELYRGEIK